MDLTGVILRARVRMKRVATSSVLVDTLRCADLDAVLAAMEDDDRYAYSVAWLDCLARGHALGRSVLTRGRFAALEELDARGRGNPLGAPGGGRLTTPPGFPNGLLNRRTVGAFNELWFRRAPRRREHEMQSVGAFFHPLDGVASWNRIYGSRGFLQEAPLTQDPSQVAQAIIAGLASGQRIVWVPGAMRWVITVMRHLPYAAFRRLPV